MALVTAAAGKGAARGLEAMLYRHLIRPALFAVDPETAHEAALGALTVAGRVPGVLRALGAGGAAPDPALQVEVLGLTFPNPIGLAAGFDKNARVVPALCALGFGAVEVGGVTALPQPGNPRPRITRRPQEQALINWMGLPNEGAEEVGRRLEAFRRRGVTVLRYSGVDSDCPSNTVTPQYRNTAIPIGLNVAGERVEDYLRVVERCGRWVDYVTLNVSCPNVPAGKQLADRGEIRALLRAMRGSSELAGLPALLKVSPDLPEVDLDRLVDLALEEGAAGMVATNTSAALAGERGGLSGAPLRERSTATIRRIRRRAGDRLTLVGVGGIFTPEDAWEKILAGASLLQLYTSFVYEGPSLLSRLTQGLSTLLAARGLRHLGEAVGAEAREAVGVRR